jgi:2-polyprenyl-3-methyl-5-hydroxy-6-metoxy-1,4-benzoquinol methylase
MAGYAEFAAYYDQLTANVDYRRRASYFHNLIKTYQSPKSSGNLLLDLACGTGSLSVELSRLGYDVIGVDASPEMLSQAMAKNSGQDRQILYLCQEMPQLDLYGTIDVAVCALDSLNHLTELRDLRRTIERVSLFLNPEGCFCLM